MNANDHLSQLLSIRKRKRQNIWRGINFTLMQQGPGSVRFGYGLGVEGFERFRFSVLAVPLQKAVFQYRLTGRDGSGSGFDSWKTVPAVPVPLSVSGKKVLTVTLKMAILPLF